MQQAGRFNKKDEQMLKDGSFEAVVGPLNLKGIPRWRRKNREKIQLPELPSVSTPQVLNTLVSNNLFRRLKCPACGLWTETAGWHTRRTHFELTTPWKNIKCGHCHKQRNAAGWVCSCGVPWFTCEVHNAAHLDGCKPKRLAVHQGSEEDAKRCRQMDMPPPQVRSIRCRNRPTEVEPSLATSLTELAPKRFKLSLPPVLKRRFPHLAE